MFTTARNLITGAATAAQGAATGVVGRVTGSSSRKSPSRVAAAKKAATTRRKLQGVVPPDSFGAIERGHGAAAYGFLNTPSVRFRA